MFKVFQSLFGARLRLLYASDVAHPRFTTTWRELFIASHTERLAHSHLKPLDKYIRMVYSHTMNNDILKNNLEDAIERRRIARLEFNRFCNCKASLGDAIGQRVEDELAEANQSVKDARKALKSANH